jgi:hypothetical protein
LRTPLHDPLAFPSTRYFYFTGWQEDRLAGVVPQHLLVVAGHENLCASVHWQRKEHRTGEHRDT